MAGILLPIAAIVARMEYGGIRVVLTSVAEPPHLLGHLARGPGRLLRGRGVVGGGTKLFSISAANPFDGKSLTFVK